MMLIIKILTQDAVAYSRRYGNGCH